jgi:hypothetical protein
MLHPMMPNQFRSSAEARRLYHEDLDDLSDTDLWRELWRIQHTLAFEDKAPEWLWERLGVLLHEQERRRREARRNADRR